MIIYKNRDETLWLIQKGMSKVIEVNVPSISKHINSICNDEELNKSLVVSKMKIAASDNKEIK